MIVRLVGYPLPPSKVCKVFEVDTLGLDFGLRLVEIDRVRIRLAGEFWGEVCQVSQERFWSLCAPLFGCALWSRSVPQRLKPRCHGSCGTAKAVPLSQTGFFNVRLLEEFLEGFGGLFGLFFEYPMAGVFEDDYGHVRGY